MGRVAGLTYGVDLLGATLGSLLAAAFLVPVLGIFQTCLLVALINVTVLALLVISYYDRPERKEFVFLRILLGGLIGGAIGYAVGYFGKCVSGVCPLTSDPILSTLIGILIGIILAAKK